MHYDAREVANLVLDHCDQAGREVSNLSLQKLVFFCHAWSLATLGRPLIKESFEAWPRGPVMPYLYHEFKSCKDQPIPKSKRAYKLDRETGRKVLAQGTFDLDIQKLLLDTIDAYSQLTAFQLMNISHASGGPWDQVWNHAKKVNPGMRITNESILAFYSGNPKRE